MTVDPRKLYEKILRSEGGFLMLPVRVAVLAARGFIVDNCSLRAATLTFYTLLSIVPLLATVFGIAKGFGLQAVVQRAITARVEWQREMIDALLKFSSSALENVRGDVIAGIGVLLFFFTIIGVLGQIESAFNIIWKVEEPRSLGRKLADYLSVVLIGTVLLAISAGATIFISAQLQFAAHRVAFLAPASRVLLSLLQIVPLAANWLLFSFVYLFMPNLRVPLSAGLVAGVVAGTLFQITQWAYVEFQIGVTSYGAIYGSFAALPLFLAWMNVSWTIALFGGEIAQAIVNRRTYGFPPEYSLVSLYLRKVIASAVMEEIVRAFFSGEKPPGTRKLCAALHVPRYYVASLLDELIDGGLVSEVKGRRVKENGYLPALPPERLSLAGVIRVFEFSGLSEIPGNASPAVKKAQERVDCAVEKGMEASRRLRMGDKVEESQ